MDREMRVRGVSGAVYVVVVVAACLIGRLYAATLFAFFALGAVYEFYTLLRKHTPFRPYLWVGMLGALGIVGLALPMGEIFGRLMLPENYLVVPTLLVLLFILYPIFAILWTRKRQPFLAMASTWAGGLLVAAPFMLILSIIFVHNSVVLPCPGTPGVLVMLAIISIVWANDTGAYLAGRAFGKHKMSPTISPKKTWEGFVGGLIFSVLLALAWTFISGYYTWALAVILGIITSISAVVGDLIESSFKRAIGVKDSGNFLPGHGGFLDRFDSLMLAAPIAGLFFYSTINLVQRGLL